MSLLIKISKRTFSMQPLTHSIREPRTNWNLILESSINQFQNSEVCQEITILLHVLVVVRVV